MGACSGTFDLAHHPDLHQSVQIRIDLLDTVAGEPVPQLLRVIQAPRHHLKARRSHTACSHYPARPHPRLPAMCSASNTIGLG